MKLRHLRDQATRAHLGIAVLAATLAGDHQPAFQAANWKQTWSRSNLEGVLQTGEGNDQFVQGPEYFSNDGQPFFQDRIPRFFQLPPELEKMRGETL